MIFQVLVPASVDQEKDSLLYYYDTAEALGKGTVDDETVEMLTEAFQKVEIDLLSRSRNQFHSQRQIPLYL
jgi:hypothetical protein